MTSPAIPSSAQPMVNSAGNIMPVWQRFFNALNLKLQQAAPAETLKKVAFSGSYQDLEHRPVLGSVASTDATAYATAAEGALAASALQPGQEFQAVMGNTSTGIGGGSTHYFVHALMDASDANVSVVMPFDCTAKGLFIACDAPGSTNTYAFTLQQNGADTALTCAISDAETSASDTSHLASFSAGDTWSIKVVSSAGAGSSGPIRFGFKLYPNA